MTVCYSIKYHPRIEGMSLTIMAHILIPGCLLKIQKPTNVPRELQLSDNNMGVGQNWVPPIL